MILFQILFEVAGEKHDVFERAYAEIFEPALSKQPGFQFARLLRLYPAAWMKEIDGDPTAFNYQFNFGFDSEQSRRLWAVSKDHDLAWPQVSALAKKAVWRGYDVLPATAKT